MTWGKEPSGCAAKIGVIVATAWMVGYVLYFGYHVVAAWLHGRFEVIAR
jgi:hypothetical protein